MAEYTMTIYPGANKPVKIVQAQPISEGNVTWMEEHEINLSSERMQSGDIVVYMDDGTTHPEDPETPLELLEIIFPNSKETLDDVITKLRAQSEARLGQESHEQ